MGKNKYQRFCENETFTLLFQPPFAAVFQNDFFLKGRWREAFFKNAHPIVLELGCGRGEYTVELARRYPAKNFIGIDRKGARLWRGAKTATEEPLPNVAFIRTHIDFITSFFATGEVDEIWITFPDPQPARPRKRLTGARFLVRYAQFLKSGGDIHLKTDNRTLHEYTKAIAQHNGLPLHEAHSDIYGAARADEILSIRTHYEKLFLRQGLPITYCRFGLGDKAAFEEPAQPADMPDDIN
ncbi:MAG: tRNA (guanosine(46)-N7)-methyltransferase TrmB [Prevotellaceae bacterium]|jgi:tRNA (guanine-N7-)-methyltransferase|nr:tRNA (guanosine(46)-N7)-methyltransferase TrmB [Prevotellaceae bacterium]